MRIVSIVGTRPNFIKIAPFLRAIQEANASRNARVSSHLIHTGQHYDNAMSQIFFDECNIPMPSLNLNIGSGTHAEQTAGVMVASRVNGTPDVVHHETNGWLAEPRNATDLAEKLCTALTHKENGICQAARKTAEHYDWPVLSERYAGLLRGERSQTEPARTLPTAT